MRLLHNTPVNITNEHMGSQSVLFEGSVQYDPLQALVNRIVEHKGCPSQTTIGKLVSHKQEVTPMDEESTKNTAKLALLVGITLFSMGLPLLIIGSISTDEDRLAMLIPGAVMFCTGIFVVTVTTKKRLRIGKGATTSEQDPASKIVSQRKVGDINRLETDDTTYLIKDDDLANEGDTNEPFWEIN